MLALAGGLAATAAPASAAASLTVTPITWNVLGLDSNKVSAGPDTFPVGVRACNTGDATASSVQATLTWDSANSYVNLSGPATLTVDSLASGTCTDFYFNVVVTRTSAAYDTTRAYHVSVSANGVTAVRTPSDRELYVEHLVSQQRNSVRAISGPAGITDPPATTVYVGQTYVYKLWADTATNGYEQLESFLNLPNVIFQVLSSTTTYTAPSGASSDKLYADACGWENATTDTDYRSCVGPVQFTGGKAGGTIVTTYTVKILSAGAATVSGLVYDFSGSSYHYNSDFGIGVNSVFVTAVE
ncbi:MAG TPA: hypothetical protein VF855_08330, partial [Acidimicrobiales bacterium]